MMADELEIVFPAYKKGGVARLVVVHRAGVGRGMYHLKKRAFDTVRSLGEEGWILESPIGDQETPRL